jgi:hypothetical protein
VGLNRGWRGALLVVPWLLGAGLAIGQSADVVVVHAEAPEFSPAAVNARLSQARVKVRVAIDAAGRVTSTAVTEQAVLGLTARAEAAAKQWLFSAAPGVSAREAVLTFRFDAVELSEEMNHVVSSFDDPLTMHLRYVQSTVLWLPRVHGTLPERRCPVHGEVMKIGLVPIRYGLARGIDVDDLQEMKRSHTFWAAKRKLFPESNPRQAAGCRVEVEDKAEVYYCQRCRENEARWSAQHPALANYAF